VGNGMNEKDIGTGKLKVRKKGRKEINILILLREMFFLFFLLFSGIPFYRINYLFDISFRLVNKVELVQVSL
jgi:hypothetical protein